MLKKNKGSILPVTVVAMFVFMMLGMFCLNMFVMSAREYMYAQTRCRAFYAAEAAVEYMRGYIVKKTNERATTISPSVLSDVGVDGRGFLYSTIMATSGSGYNDGNINAGRWYPFRIGGAAGTNHRFDREFSGIYPKIRIVDVYCRRMSKNPTSSTLEEWGYWNASTTPPLDLDFRLLQNRYKNLGGSHSVLNDDSVINVYLNPSTARTDFVSNDMYVICARVQSEQIKALGSVRTIYFNLYYYFTVDRKNIGTSEEPIFTVDYHFVGVRYWDNDVWSDASYSNTKALTPTGFTCM